MAQQLPEWDRALQSRGPARRAEDAVPECYTEWVVKPRTYLSKLDAVVQNQNTDVTSKYRVRTTCL
jgi:hypothetical protein